jgi:hypothetical protein
MHNVPNLSSSSFQLRLNAGSRSNIVGSDPALCPSCLQRLVHNAIVSTMEAIKYDLDHAANSFIPRPPRS